MKSVIKSNRISWKGNTSNMMEVKTALLFWLGKHAGRTP
jgi:hypothetical protein